MAMLTIPPEQHSAIQHQSVFCYALGVFGVGLLHYYFSLNIISPETTRLVKSIAVITLCSLSSISYSVI